MFSKKIATMMLGLSAALLTGCEAEQTEKDMIAEAQFCLDEARDGSSAQACMSKIDGLTSTQAYTLRCATGFISAGVTSPEKLSSALNSLSENGSTASVLGILAFEDLDGPYGANNTFEYCNKANSTGLSLLGAMAKTASVIGNLTSGSGDLEAQFQTAIQDILADLSSGDPGLEADAIENAAAIGSSIQAVYTTSCGGTTTAIDDICSSINGAIAEVPGLNIATASEAQIGEALLDYWQNLNN